MRMQLGGRIDGRFDESLERSAGDDPIMAPLRQRDSATAPAGCTTILVSPAPPRSPPRSARPSPPPAAARSRAPAPTRSSWSRSGARRSGAAVPRESPFRRRPPRCRPGPTVTSTTRAPAFRAFSSRLTTTSFTSSARAAPLRTRLAREPDRAPFLRQPVELDDLADHDAEIDPVERLDVVGRRGEAAEGPGDRVEPVDLGQHPLGGVLERAVEVGAAVPVDPPEVLQAEAHRGERILDLVRHLARHLTPGQHALGAGDVGDVVEGDHDASDLRAQRGELERDPAAARLELGGGLGGRGRRGSGGPRR